VAVRAGELDERVEIQQPTEVRDASGGFTLTWAKLATVSAKIEPQGAGEVREGEKQAARARYAVTIRYRADVTAQMRLKWRTRTLQIDGMPSGSKRSEVTVLMCVEAQD
jgi:SPP1 family predicted phage head-tail adaptor